MVGLTKCTARQIQLATIIFLQLISKLFYRPQFSLVSDGTPGELIAIDWFRLGGLSAAAAAVAADGGGSRGLPGGNRILPYFDDLEHNHQLTQNTKTLCMHVSVVAQAAVLT